MKKILFVFLLISAKLFAQDSVLHTLGALPTPLSALKNVEISIPMAGAAGEFPPSVRMDNECPIPNDQGQIGSCVSQSTAYGACAILAKRQGMQAVLSPMFMHFFIKQGGGNCNSCDCMGSWIVKAANFLKDTGVPMFDNFNPNTCFLPPPNNLPIAFKITSFNALVVPYLTYSSGVKTYTIKSNLAKRNPVPISMQIDDGFWRGYALNNSQDTWKRFVGPSKGGHAMLVVGYDDDRHAFLVMNSWGPNWNITHHDPTNNAKGGFCWIDYDIVDQYCSEAYIFNDNSGYTIPVSQLVSSTVASTKSENNVRELAPNVGKPFFEENRYNQYGDIRFIPTNVDKSDSSATIAIYRVEHDQPKFLTAFDIKLGQTKTIDIQNKTYQFSALEIKPWRKYFIFNSKNALFYKLSVTE